MIYANSVEYDGNYEKQIQWNIDQKAEEAVTISTEPDEDHLPLLEKQNSSSCKMIEQHILKSKRYNLAINGHVFRHLVENRTKNPELLTRIVGSATIFASMSPDDKAKLIDLLQEREQHVCMVGDGANDCIALKQAAVGISISNTEASIAAPFTSRREDISCVPILLKEGRGSLAMSF